jgi:hypothetical protein
MSGPGDVPVEILGRVRPICLGLPETYEQTAWIGVRWQVRKRTFAHLYHVDPDDDRVVAIPTDVDGPTCRLTFQSSADELDALVHSGHPFYKVSWSTNGVLMVLGADTDWTEVTELLTESYCLRAPQKLVGQVLRP